MRQLGIYNNNVLAGVLTEQVPGKDYVFTYEPAYLASGGVPVSVTLPLQSAPYESESLFPFFVNMCCQKAPIGPLFAGSIASTKMTSSAC